MDRCPDCEWIDVTTYGGAREEVRGIPCARCRAVAVPHVAAVRAAPGLSVLVLAREAVQRTGVTAEEAAQSIRAAFATDAPPPEPYRHVYCMPERRPPVAWLRPHRLYFRGCGIESCAHRWCWDAGQWRKVLTPNEIRELERILF